MCCCKQKCCTRTLAVLSVGVLIMGIVIIVFGAQMRGAAIFKSDNENVENVSDVAFYAMVVFGALAFVVALLGFLTCYFNKCFCIGCFAFFAFIVWLIFLIVGAVLIFIGTVGQETIDEYCAGTTGSEWGDRIAEQF